MTTLEDAVQLLQAHAQRRLTALTFSLCTTPAYPHRSPPNTRLIDFDPPPPVGPGLAACALSQSCLSLAVLLSRLLPRPARSALCLRSWQSYRLPQLQAPESAITMVFVGREC